MTDILAPLDTDNLFRKLNNDPRLCRFSPCGNYRYMLWRKWWSEDLWTRRDKPRYAMFIGLNPSVADEAINDNTVTRCIHFAQRWEMDAMVMTNLFAYRSTNPKEMKEQDDPIGPENDQWLLACAKDAVQVICCWGNHGEFSMRGAQVRDELCQVADLKMFKLTKRGNPIHPLYLPNNSKLEVYAAKRCVE